MPVVEKTWTILDIIKWGTGYLSEKGFEEARLNTELLLSEILRLKRFDLYVKHDQPLRKTELDEFKVLLKRRLAHEPIQYILGRTNFYSIDLKIDRRALIPRPETESLVEAAVDQFRTSPPRDGGIRVLDLGTGSGCVAIALARFLPGSRVVAVDNSTTALDLARENAVMTGTSDRIEFRSADILKMGNDEPGGEFDLIVSNPPYVSSSEFASLAPEIRDYEPMDAVSDASDGLVFYRQISKLSPGLLTKGGWVFVETSYNRSKEVTELFRNEGAAELVVKKDLSGIDRVVGARYSK